MEIERRVEGDGGDRGRVVEGSYLGGGEIVGFEQSSLPSVLMVERWEGKEKKG